jgi:hypothetical protein
VIEMTEKGLMVCIRAKRNEVEAVIMKMERKMHLGAFAGF